MAVTLTKPAEGTVGWAAAVNQNFTDLEGLLNSLTGVILPFGGTAAPTGWLLCDGTSYNRVGDYAALFAVIGTAFGAPDANTFRVPDLRGRFLRGRDAGQGRDPDAAGRTTMATGGASGDAVGSIQANATKLPNTSFTADSSQGNHTHSGTTGNASQPFHQIAEAGGGATCWAPAGGTDISHTHSFSIASSGAHGHTVNGGGDSESRPVNAYVNFIIKT